MSDISQFDRPDTSSQDSDDDGIHVFQLLALLWRGKWAISLSIVLCASIAGTYALRATPWFRGDVLVAQTTNGGAGSALGSLGALASLAGVNVEPGGGSQNAVAVLRSRQLARDFIEAAHIEPDLLKAQAQEAGMFGRQATEKGDIRDAVAFFDEKVRFVGEDRRTGLVNLSITWLDPVVAAEWANQFIKLANARLKQQALEQSQGNIAYLRKELLSTNVPSLQQALSKVLESEMQKMLMAQGGEAYAFKIIDLAVVPRDKVRPKRLVIVVGGAVLGFLLGCCWVFLRQSHANHKFRVKT